PRRCAAYSRWRAASERLCRSQRDAECIFRYLGQFPSQGVQGWTDIQPDEDTFGIREISNDALDRWWKAADQRGNGQDLISGGQLRADQQVDDLNGIAPGEVLLANLFQICDCGE